MKDYTGKWVYMNPGVPDHIIFIIRQPPLGIVITQDGNIITKGLPSSTFFENYIKSTIAEDEIEDLNKTAFIGIFENEQFE